MEIGNLLQKYRDLKYETPITLFEPDFRVAVKGFCPFCGCKLYEMRGKGLMYCKSKKHRKRFVMAKSKLITV